MKQPNWNHRHPPELHAIGLGLCEELPAHLPDCTFHFNAGDCEVMVNYGRQLIATLDLDDEIEVWTVGSPCGIAGKADYASPNFLHETANIINRLLELHRRKTGPMPK